MERLREKAENDGNEFAREQLAALEKMVSWGGRALCSWEGTFYMHWQLRTY
jgi:hypothetical protein